MPVLLVVDDDAATREAVLRVLQGGDTEAHAAGTAAAAVAAVPAVQPDVIVLDLFLPDATGLEAFHRLRVVAPSTPIVVLTGLGTPTHAAEAVRDGAYDYLVKPPDMAELRAVVGRAIRSSLLARTAHHTSETRAADALLGNCRPMRELHKAIGRAAGQDSSILIRGERATGKALVARAIAQNSRRAGMALLVVDCSALPEPHLDQVLFGCEAGGAPEVERQRIGAFEQCHGGTVVMLEIADLNSRAQAKILRLLQEQQIERAGGYETVRTDVRLIATTSADLDLLAETGRFRRDLHLRLSGLTLRVPPLRERGDDVSLLARHFIRRCSGELNKPVKEIDPAILPALAAHSWPGNFRELQETIRRAIEQMTGTTLTADLLIPFLSSAAPSSNGANNGFDWDLFVGVRLCAGREDLYLESLDRMEREILVRTLRHTGGNQVKAARLLGITRGSLRTKIRKRGIDIDRVLQLGPFPAPASDQPRD